MASAREKVLIVASERNRSSINTTRATEISSKSGNSLDTVSRLILIGRMIAAIPINNNILIILLPMTLPTRISVLPLMMDENDTANSGAPVPKATIVSPMRSLLTLKLDAADDAPSTNQSAPLIKMIKPIISNAICNIISIVIMIITHNNKKGSGWSWILMVVRAKRL